MRGSAPRRRTLYRRSSHHSPLPRFSRYLRPKNSNNDAPKRLAASRIAAKMQRPHLKGKPAVISSAADPDSVTTVRFSPMSGVRVD